MSITSTCGLALGIGENRILHVLRCTQADEHVAARLALPLDDRVEPELRELERAGILGARHLDHVRRVGKVVEALADVAAMERAESRIR